VVEKVERFSELGAIVLLFRLTLCNQRSGCQVCEFRGRCLGQRPAKLQNAANSILSVPTLAQPPQIFRGQRRRPIAEQEESGAEVGCSISL
jgi:hypothetical protein